MNPVIRPLASSVRTLSSIDNARRFGFLASCSSLKPRVSSHFAAEPPTYPEKSTITLLLSAFATFTSAAETGKAPTATHKPSVAIFKYFDLRCLTSRATQLIPSSITASWRSSSCSTSAGGGVIESTILSIVPLNLLSPSL
jgi:hypothetical protein